MNKSIIIFSLILALPILLVFSMATGAMNLEIGEIIQILVNKIDVSFSNFEPSGVQNAIVWNIRLPRVLMSLLVGASLGICGTAMQGLFRNHLADPSIVGISAGAALFASLTIVLGGSFFSATWLGVSALSFASFTGAVLATILVFTISQEKRGTNVATMLLAGIAINALAGACMGVLTYLADDAQLRSLTFWTLGSLGGSNWLSVAVLSLVTVSSVIFLSRLYKPFNALALGEREAVNLGISVEKLKVQVVAFTALSIGSAVAFCGMIGFVGLVVPHILRLFGGSDHRFLLPASALGGALLLGVADTASRTVAAPAELPIGIITSLFGAPIFLWLIYRKR